MAAPPSFTRRAFLCGAAALLPAARSWGAPGLPDATGRFPTLHAGLGRRGAELARAPEIDPRGFFDVDAAQIRAAAPPARLGAEAAVSYADMLRSGQASAVIIATPDHWHARQAIAACEAGMDVYLESPCIWQPREAKTLLAAAERWGVVVQTGELLPYTRAGVALKESLASYPADALLKVICRAPRNPTGGDWSETAPPPDGFDWREWLGPAPGRPFHPGYAHVNWRYMLDWGGGHIRSMGTPVLATLLWSLGITAPRSVVVSATGAAPASGLWQCPPDFSARIRVDDRLEMEWQQGEIETVETEVWAPSGMLTLHGMDGDAVLTMGESGAAHTGWDGATAIGHWTQAMVQRSAPRLSVATACAASAITQLAVLAWRTQSELVCDMDSLTVENNPLVTRMLQAGAP